MPRTPTRPPYPLREWLRAREIFLKGAPVPVAGVAFSALGGMAAAGSVRPGALTTFVRDLVGSTGSIVGGIIDGIRDDFNTTGENMGHVYRRVVANTGGPPSVPRVATVRRLTMSQQQLGDGIARLETISAEFDYGKARDYVLLAKEFCRAIKEIAGNARMDDLSKEFEIDMPANIKMRLEAFLATKPAYAPTTKDVCRWYLLELHAMDLGLKSSGLSLYEPLIQLLELGGDFYEHHGALCIRDVAMLP